MGRSICYECLVCFLFFLRLLHFVLVWCYDKTDLLYVTVVFPMMITTSELDDGSIQILRDYIDELLLCVFPLLHAKLIPLINIWAT